MEELFLKNNEPAFEQSLEETRNYNRQMLRRSLVQSEIKRAATNSALKPHNDEIKADLTKLKDDYNARIKGQFLSFLRSTGKAKSQMISKACLEAMQAIDAKDPSKAQEVLVKLKGDFEKMFGKTVTFGKSSKGFQMIEKLENKIQDLIDQKLD